MLIALQHRKLSLSFWTTRVLLSTAIFAVPFSLSAENPLSSEARWSCPTVEEEIIDLEMLANSLKKTRAIGMLHKVRLKSDIDKLLKRLRAFHDGRSDFSLDQLEEQYNVLLMKIAAFLQARDIDLHQQLCNAWDVIWRDLKDEDRFREQF